MKRALLGLCTLALAAAPALTAAPSAQAEPVCSPTLTECPRCKNNVLKCDGTFAPPSAQAELVALQLLRDELPHAEWEDKHIHPVGAESFQNWRISIRLPVPLSETDKSPEAALNRLLKGKT